MKHVFTSLLVGFWLISMPTLAQKKSTKLYVANVNSGTKLTPKELKRRNDEIKFQATTKINKNLLDLLNTLTSDSLGESERTSVIQNSFLPNADQVFYGDDVVVEDDIDPTHTSAENVIDLVVERYLRNLDLFYAKSGTFSISFSQVITSDVQEGKDSPFIKVFFTSHFKGKHTQIATPYKPVQRVAELRAEKVDGKWRTFITRLAFLQPGEALTQLSKPVISKDFGPKRPIAGQEKIFKKADNAADSVAAKWDQNWLNIVRSSIDMLPIGFYQRSKTVSKGQTNISIRLTNQDQHLIFQKIDGSLIAFNQPFVPSPPPPKYRLLAWLQIATGVVALGVSYAGYASLRNSYNTYTAQLTNLNSDYAIWQTLTQQSAGNPATPVAFNSYASPGIYAVYGGGLAGGGLIINGIRQLIKAGKTTKTQNRE